MFNKLKGAIDYVDQRFQEEQARARAAQGQIARSNSNTNTNTNTRRPENKGSTRPSRSGSLDRRQKEGSSRGPDPSEFDPELVAGSDETEVGKSASPGPAREQETTAHSSGPNDGADLKSGELPQDVKVKLRKLERLEFKYQELLRSYRIAHARVGAIEPFEAALRENTPLTSINDPSALTEYLNQVNRKGDMVLEELKRVSAERSSFKTKLDEAEKETRRAWDEVTQLKSRSAAGGDTMQQLQRTEASVSEASEKVTTETPKLDEDTTSKQQPLPREKSVEHADPSEDTGDLFSYDDELPRIEAELKKSQSEVARLQGEVARLEGDLKSAQDSTESMSRDLEATTKELNAVRDIQSNAKNERDRLVTELEAADTKYRRLEHEISSKTERPDGQLADRLKEAQAELESLRHLKREAEESSTLVAKLQKDLHIVGNDLEKEKEQSQLQSSTSTKLIDEMKQKLSQAEKQVNSLETEKEKLQKSIQAIKAEAQNQAEAASKELAEPDGDQDSLKHNEDLNKPESGRKSNKKKKKKGGKAAGNTGQAETANKTYSPDGQKEAGSDDVLSIQRQLDEALTEVKQKNAEIDRVKLRLKDQEGLQDEIDTLRDDLVDKGQDLVDAKETIKELQIERDGLNKTIGELRNELVELRGSHANSSAETHKAHKDLAAQFEDLKTKSNTLETDLAMAQQLASSRFKDLSELREKMQKAQPEIRSLKNENEELKRAKKELDEKVTSLDRIQFKHDNLQSQVNELKKSVSERTREISSLSLKLGTESDSKQKLELESRRLKGDLASAQSEAKNTAQSLEKVSGELSQARQTVRRHETRIRELEAKTNTLETEEARLKEEIELKSAQYASAESLMNSMRDQTSEIATQLKESRERCESLDEEVADAHRLLTERTREGETMRRLLAEVEARTDSRIREMRDRMDTAVEERERIEDETSTNNRRRAREVEEARSRLREVERELRTAREAYDELEAGQREWKRRREELEQSVERGNAETEEARTAMGRIRDALDESEKQARDLERQKADLRRSFEDSRLQIDKLEKRNKALAEEVKALQGKSKTTLASPTPSSPVGSRVMSPSPARRESSARTEDHISQGVYIKSVLLQFLEMKEKKHQVQFVPTLANLLQLDGADQQKLTAAIMAR